MFKSWLQRLKKITLTKKTSFTELKLKRLARGELLCPCCEQVVSPSQYRIYSNQIDVAIQAMSNSYLDFAYQGDVDTARKNHLQRQSYWACDDCFDSGKAIVANPDDQESGLYCPYFAYYDKQGVCRTCKKDFVFSKFEQRFWYETLKFWVMSDAVNCKACRQMLRDKKKGNIERQAEIEQRLEHLDHKDPVQIQAVIDLYRENGSHKRVKHFEHKLNQLNLK